MVQHIVPRRRLTEGLTWLSTAINIGVSLGASTAGTVIDAAGSRGGFLVVAAGGVAAVVTVAVAVPALRGRDRGDALPTP